MTGCHSAPDGGLELESLTLLIVSHNLLSSSFNSSDATRLQTGEDPTVEEPVPNGLIHSFTEGNSITVRQS